MKKSKYSEAKIISILNEHVKGRPVAEICREYGMSQPTFYQWKSKYGGMSASQLNKLKELEEEKRDLVTYMKEKFKMSIRQACDLIAVIARAFWISIILKH